MLASCPMCGEDVVIRDDGVRVNRMLRCPDCDTRLRVAKEYPVTLDVFRSHGLAFNGGQVRGVWSREPVAVEAPDLR